MVTFIETYGVCFLSLAARRVACSLAVMVVCLVPLLTTGCVGTRVDTATEVPVGIPDGYVLCPGDEISIDVYREPNLSGTFRLDSSCSIQHPLLGIIELPGFTAAEAEKGITMLLADFYLVNPRVMVRVTSSQSSQIVILGEVKKPGVRAIPFGNPVTLLQAVAEAGGFTDLASMNRVRIVRGKEGRQQQLRVKVMRIIDGRDPDVRLEPNDVIIVPQTLF